MSLPKLEEYRRDQSSEAVITVKSSPRTSGDKRIWASFSAHQEGLVG